MVGWRQKELRDECGKFHNNDGVESFLRCWGIRAPQQPTDSAPGRVGPDARTGRDGDTAGRISQLPLGTTMRLEQGGLGNHHI